MFSLESSVLIVKKSKYVPLNLSLSIKYRHLIRHQYIPNDMNKYSFRLNV